MSSRLQLRTPALTGSRSGVRIGCCRGKDGPWAVCLPGGARSLRPPCGKRANPRLEAEATLPGSSSQALPDWAQVAHPRGPQVPHLPSGRTKGPASVSTVAIAARGRGLGIAVPWLRPILADQAAGVRLYAS